MTGLQAADQINPLKKWLLERESNPRAPAYETGYGTNTVPAACEVVAPAGPAPVFSYFQGTRLVCFDVSTFDKIDRKD